MNLSMWHGKAKAQEVVSNGRIMLVKVKGEWYAMNHRSQSPMNLANQTERSTWAHLVGFKVKDVEAYVRREKRRVRHEAMVEELEHARGLLEGAGFTVEKR
jgi:hypothetical protein